MTVHLWRKCLFPMRKAEALFLFISSAHYFFYISNNINNKRTNQLAWNFQVYDKNKIKKYTKNAEQFLWDGDIFDQPASPLPSVKLYIVKSNKGRKTWWVLGHTSRFEILLKGMVLSNQIKSNFRWNKFPRSYLYSNPSFPSKTLLRWPWRR